MINKNRKTKPYYIRLFDSKHYIVTNIKQINILLNHYLQKANNNISEFLWLINGYDELNPVLFTETHREHIKKKINLLNTEIDIVLDNIIFNNNISEKKISSIEQLLTLYPYDNKLKKLLDLFKIDMISTMNRIKNIKL